MTERPILFSGAMVEAILAGRKTQTRRVVTLKNEHGLPLHYSRIVDHSCPYGKKGDRLWVRETFRCVSVGEYGIASVEYRADGKIVEIENTREAADLWFDAYRDGEKWRPSIFMPRWASRIVLEIVNIRVERVQDISRADAIAEGMTEPQRPYSTALWQEEQYQELWNKINGPRGYGWDVNPWVWVLEYKPISFDLAGLHIVHRVRSDWHDEVQ